MPPDERAPSSHALTILRYGEVEVRGRMPWSSNATFLVELCHEGTSMHAIYKPHRGERPLWDFPDGLHLREVAAYRLSEALGWDIVPETVAREEAPLGPGSLQRFVPADFAEHYFTLLERPELHDALRTIATFDLVANNADRKGGHCLIDEDGRLWAIDNGLCFHVSPGLRTVIWDFAGQPVPEALLADLERYLAGPETGLEDLLRPAEVDAVRQRAAAVLRHPSFPEPSASRHAYPWPLV
ncbi:MAG TPA: SCO1664 family protein [Acidimicrobiales bacterium]|nr:SCO1664 family protein [Acidimicrobiales bacterium]